MVRKILLLAGMFLIMVNYSAAGEVLQTQESELWDGIEADITGVRIKNNIVTVKFKLRNTGQEKHSVKIFYDSCYLMDENNQKKYYILKDSDGIYIAGPQADEDRGGRFWYTVESGKANNMWIKFPQPTDNPESVTISLAGFFPFEEIPLEQKQP